MHLRLRNIRFSAWLAIWVIVMGALAPSVSRLLASRVSHVLPTLEVCATRTNAHGVMIKAADAPSHPLTSANLDHCALCVIQADQVGLPPANFAWHVASTLSESTPTLFLTAPRPLHVWATALARAPPAFLA